MRSFTHSSSATTLSSQDDCRSLICDANGVIIAETVYRCMRCGVISDNIRNAKSHYYALHIEEDEEDEELMREDGCFEEAQEDCLNLSSKRKPYCETFSNEKQLKRFKSSSPDAHRSTSLPYTSSSLTSKLEDLKEDAKDHQVAKYLGREISDSSSYDIEDPERDGIPNQLPRDVVLPRGSTTGAVGKAGHISCAVCGVVRYYSCVYRRYGQFTCQVCYRFFRTFFLQPKIYVCNTLGECPLNVRNRCRACWIKACIEVYAVDGGRREIVEKHLPSRHHVNLTDSSETEDTLTEANGNQSLKKKWMQPNVMYRCSSDSSSLPFPSARGNSVGPSCTVTSSSQSKISSSMSKTATA